MSFRFWILAVMLVVNVEKVARALNISPRQVQRLVDQGGEVWYDLNRNGQKDLGENPGGNIRVVCSCGTDAVTTVDGSFILGDLLPGEVFLSVDLQGLPPLYEVVPKRVQVRVLSGRQVNGIRFSLQPRERPIEEQAQPPQQLVRRPLE